MGEVVRPRALTYKGTFHQCVCRGVSARRVLPTICVHMCRVSAVSLQSAHLNSGHGFVPLLIVCPPCPDPYTRILSRSPPYMNERGISFTYMSHGKPRS